MIFRYLRIACIVLAVLLPMSAHAQSPRKILVEEITNASAPAAYSQDSVFHWVYINRKAPLQRIIPIVYHANYPGIDSFNLLRPEMHNTRTAFYGNPAPPIVRINGAIPASGSPYPGAPGDTAAMTAALAAHAGEMSPITITITQKVQGSQVKGTIKVSSTEAIAGKRLHIAALDYFMGYPNAGTAGLPLYYFVPQQMFPDANGTELTLAAGETKEFPVSFTPREFALKTTYFAAFVQDPGTKEVLQAEHSILIPSIASVQDEHQIHEAVEPFEWSAGLGSTQELAYQTLVLGTMPEGWTYSVTVDGRELAEYDQVELKPGTDLPMKVKITPSAGSADRKGVVTVIVSGQTGFSDSKQYVLHAGPTETLVLNWDRNTTVGIVTAIKASMDSIGGSYAHIFEGEERFYDLSRHIVLILTGKQSLSPEHMAMLRPAIDKGARLLVSGAEIGYTLADPANVDPFLPRDTAFLHNYLHANYLADKSSSFRVVGKEGDPVGNGLSFMIDDGVTTQDAPDVIGTRDGSEPAFYYGTGSSEIAGIRYADAKNRLIFLGFGIEGIGNEELRTDLTRKGIEWLRGSSGVPTEPRASGMLLGAPWPNPATRAITIPVHLEHASQVRVAIYNSRGQEAASLDRTMLDAGDGMLHIDCSALPAGAYRVVLRTPEGIATTPVSIVR